MSEIFTPLTFGTLPLRERAAGAPTATPSAAQVVTSFKPIASPAGDSPPVDPCAKPTVTMQRNAAGAVTSIRVQCPCGKVTELNCVY